MTSGSEGKRVPVFAVGMLVAVTMVERSAPERTYAGRVEALDVHGLRVCSEDELRVFIPWRSIASALVAMPEQDASAFRREAAKVRVTP